MTRSPACQRLVEEMGTKFENFQALKTSEEGKSKKEEGKNILTKMFESIKQVYKNFGN